MRQFKPFVVVVVVLAIAVIGWTAFHQGKTGPHFAKGALMQVATAPPISDGQAAPHPDWGACNICHQVLSHKKAAKTAATTMAIATAPPIQAGQARPHPDWGSCNNCHTVLRASKPRTGAKAAASAAPPLGIWLRPLTSASANELGLVITDGVLVSGISASAPAKQAGLQIGDVISRIDNIDVDTVTDALAVLGQKGPKDTVKLQIIRNGRRRNIHVPIGNLSESPTPRAMIAAGPNQNGTIAVASTDTTRDAQVAPSFGQAPVFQIYNPSTQSFSPLVNRAAGSLTAALQATQELVRAGVGAVIVGRIGPSSLGRLRASGVRVFTGAFGPVDQIVMAYRKGDLVEATSTRLPNAVPGRTRLSPVLNRVAVAAEQPSPHGRVAASLSTAPYIIIYSLRTGELEPIAKEQAGPGGAAEVQTAHLLVEHGAAALLAGNISAGTVQTLSSLGVFSFAGVSGTVAGAIQMLRAGQLKMTTVPTSLSQTVAPSPTLPQRMTF